MHERRSPDRILQRLSSLEPLRCAQCHRFAGPGAYGWRGYRTDTEEDGDRPGVAFFCEICSLIEFDAS